MTIGCSGVLALLAAAWQPYFVASPERELGRYLCLWISVAAVSTIVAGGEMYWRMRTTSSALSRQMTQLAVEQLAPSLVVGAFLTLCIYRCAPQVAWMLPGLWSLVFGLGVRVRQAALQLGSAVLIFEAGPEVCQHLCYLRCKAALR